MKTKAFFALSLTLLVAIGLARFSPVQAEAQSPRPSGEVIVIERATKTHKWHLTTPGKAGLAQVHLRLSTLEGKPITGKKITGELLMPEMPMVGYPMPLEFVEEDREPGTYTTLAQYMHGGFWRIAVRVPCCNEKFFLENFDLDLSE